MITDPKIDIGDASYSRLSHVLRFTAGANAQAIQMVEDICGRNDMSMEEVAHEMGKILENAIHAHYHRGGMRRKYD